MNPAQLIHSSRFARIHPHPGDGFSGQQVHDGRHSPRVFRVFPLHVQTGKDSAYSLIKAAWQKLHVAVRGMSQYSLIVKNGDVPLPCHYAALLDDAIDLQQQPDPIASSSLYEKHSLAEPNHNMHQADLAHQRYITNSPYSPLCALTYRHHRAHSPILEEFACAG